MRAWKINELQLHVLARILLKNTCQGNNTHKSLTILNSGVRDSNETGKVHTEDLNSGSKVLFLNEMVDP